VALLLGNAAVLMLQSYFALAEKDYGFDTDSVLTARLTVQGPEYDSQEAVRRFHHEVVDRVSALPGVSSAAVISKLPLEGGSNTTLVEAEGHDFSTEKGPAVEVSIVSDGYFEAIGTPIVLGRSLERADSEMGEPRPAVINRKMAGSLWPEESPLGRTFSLTEEGRSLTVVGVVEDVPQFGPEREAISEAYLPFDPDPPSPFFAYDTVRYLVVRAHGDPMALAASLRAEVAQIDPDQPVSDLRTTGEILASALRGRRFNTLLAGSFALATLLLAAAGIYGVVAFVVAHRTPEIGVRMALGATWSDIRRLILGHAIRMSGLGVGLGLASIVATTGLTRSMIHGLSPLDPLTVIACIAALLAVTALGALLPARRAARVDPVRALKAD
jgi:predicted permease